MSIALTFSQTKPKIIFHDISSENISIFFIREIDRKIDVFEKSVSASFYISFT